MKLPISQRSTTEIVVLMFSIVISVVLVLLIVAAVLSKLIHPQVEITNLSETVTSLIGVMIGFIGGRAVGKLEANGNEKTQS